MLLVYWDCVLMDDPWPWGELCPLRPIMDGWKSGWRRACLIRWSLRMKRLAQSGHWKRFSPVWVRRWRASSSERANFFSQLAQVHGNGLSPATQTKHTRHLNTITLPIHLNVLNNWPSLPCSIQSWCHVPTKPSVAPLWCWQGVVLHDKVPPN